MRRAGRQTTPQAEGWYRVSKVGHLPEPYVRFISLWEALCAWFRDVEDISQDARMKGWLEENLSDWHGRELGEAGYRASVHRLKSVSAIGIMRGTEQVGEKEIANDSDFGQIVGAIYTVRCNLMKGGKPADPSDREIQVCNAASDVLDSIVEYLIRYREADDGL